MTGRYADEAGLWGPSVLRFEGVKDLYRAKVGRKKSIILNKLLSILSALVLLVIYRINLIIKQERCCEKMEKAINRAEKAMQDSQTTLKSRINKPLFRTNRPVSLRISLLVKRGVNLFIVDKFKHIHGLHVAELCNKQKILSDFLLVTTKEEGTVKLCAWMYDPCLNEPVQDSISELIQLELNI